MKVTDSVLSPSVTFAATTGGKYSLTLENSTALTQGSYSGNLTVDVCSDSACTQAVAGSPVTLPYAFTITQAAGLATHLLNQLDRVDTVLDLTPTREYAA